MKHIISIFFLLSIFTVSMHAQSKNNGSIILKPRTQNTNRNNIPPTNNNTNRVKHENIKALENIELRYTVGKLGQDSKHTHYRIIGHIYSNLNVPIFGHNYRIVMFKIDNWDSGFLNDDLQSIDGYATNQKLNNGGVLYQFGQTNVREFSFDFKVKRGLQPYVRSEIIADWRPIEDYEQYLLLEYAALSGDWQMENQAETKINLQFSPQGEQMVMTDLHKQQIAWTRTDEKTFIRKIGNLQAPQTSNTQTGNRGQNTNTNPNPNSSDYPAGGYLGGGNQSNQQGNSNGGYLGGNRQGMNDNTSNRSGQNQNTQNGGGYLGDQSQSNEGYSSVIQIVDRKTLKYMNSEGIVVTLVRSGM